MRFFLLFIFTFLFYTLPVFLNFVRGQNMDTPTSPTASYFIIQDIKIEGNKKTKERIILRELDFSKGDTVYLENLEERIRKITNRIFNTKLFNSVDLDFIGEDPVYKEARIIVTERWYTYPLVILDLADRNFNEWWQLRGRDPGRLEYGIYFVQKNTRGRNESLKIKITTGFSQKAEIFYAIPYIDPNQTIGLNVFSNLNLHRQIAYKTSDHILSFYEDPGYIRRKFSSGFELTKRRKFYQMHVLGLSFHSNIIADTIAELNPNYFLDGRTRQRYVALRYSFIHDERDLIFYPLKGKYFRFDAEKIGTGFFEDVNIFRFRLDYSVFVDLGNKFYFAAGFKNKFSRPDRQPYILFQGLGYNKEIVSGYELNVIDGHSFSLVKLNLKRQLFATQKTLRNVSVSQFKTIPIAVYFKVYSDAGYVAETTFNPENLRLANQFLWGGGAGFDIVTFYDMVFRLEYSINNQLQRGFFLNMRAPI